MLFELTQLIDAVPGLAWTALPDGRTEFFNRRWLDYTGMTADHAQGAAWAEAVHPDDRERLVEEWQSCLAAGAPIDTEARIRRFDGSYRCFLIRANPLRDESGTILKWCGTCIDIETRKRAGEILRANVLDAPSLLDNIPGFLGRHSPDGTPEIVNRPFLQYQGKTVEEIGQWRTSDVVHPDDLSHVMEGFANGISGGEPWGLEFRLRRFDGMYRWFQARWVPVRDGDGRILHWNALTTDIDDRKKAEAALKSNERNLSLIINTIPAHIYVLNTEGYVQYVNQAVMDYTGLSMEDVKQEDYRDRVIHPEDFKRVREPRAAGLRRGVPFSTEQRVLGIDGQYRWFLVRYRPLHDEQGRIVRWYVAAFDIEDGKRAADQLQRLANTRHSIPAAVWSVTPSGAADIVNQGWYDYTGQTPEDVHSRPEAWMATMHPDDREAAERVYWDGIRSGSGFTMEARFLRARDQSYRWHLNRAVGIRDPEGNIIRFVGTSTDIRSEEHTSELQS